MDYARNETDQLVGSARRNPIPLALALGVGAAWLLTNRSRRSSSSRPSRDAGRTGEERNYSSASEQQSWSEDETGWMAKDPPQSRAGSACGGGPQLARVLERRA